MTHLNQNQIRILGLLTQYQHLTITEIKELLGLRTPPYNEVSSLQNEGCIQQYPSKEVVSYQLTTGGSFVLQQHQGNLQKV